MHKAILLLCCLFLNALPSSFSQGETNSPEPTQESLDDAIRGAMYLTVQKEGKTVYQTDDKTEILNTQHCLAIKNDGRRLAHGHGDYQFFFAFKGKKPVKLHVSLFSVEWSGWGYQAVLKNPSVLENWLKSHGISKNEKCRS